MNAREQRLLMAFGCLLLLGLGFIGFKVLTRWKLTIEDREQKVTNRRVEAEELLSQKDYWMQRAEWITQKQPTYRSQKEADNELETLVVDSSKQHGVSVGARAQEQPVPMGSSTSVAITITEAKAPYEKMLRWLHALQHPESFVAITAITLKPDAEDTSQLYATDIRIQKWYRNEDAAAPQEVPAP